MISNLKKVWGVRHIRWFYLSWRLYSHIRHCRSWGLGYFAQPADLEYLERVWRGEI